MAEALRLDVEIGGADRAKEALADLFAAFVKAGDSSEVAARKVDQFEKSIKETAAKKEAKRALDDLAKAKEQVGKKADEAEPKIKKFDASTSALLGTIARYAAPAVIGAAILRTAEWASGLTDLSRATNISLGNLQKFENIGRNYSLTAQQIASNVLMMSDRIAGGDKSAAAALDKLGLSATRFVNLNPDQAFLELASAVAKVENPMERVALAKDVLGRSAATLLPMLLDLNTEWEKQSDVLSDQTIQSLDKLDDAWQQVKASGTRLLAEVVAPLAPAFIALADAITAAAQSSIPTARNWFDGMIEKFMELRVQIAEARKAWEEWRLLPDWTYLDVKGAAGRQPSGVHVGSAQWLRDELEAFRRNRNAPGGSPGAANDWQGPPFNHSDTAQLRRERERLERERAQFELNWNNSKAKFQEDLKNDAELVKQFIDKTNLEYLKSVTAWSRVTNEQLTKPMADAIVSNAKLQSKYQIDLTKLVEKHTLSRVDFQIAQIKRWADNEKAQLDRTAGNWRENVDLINQIAHEMNVEALEELWQGPPEPPQNAARDWGNVANNITGAAFAVIDFARAMQSATSSTSTFMNMVQAAQLGQSFGSQYGGTGGGIFGFIGGLIYGWGRSRQQQQALLRAQQRGQIDEMIRWNDSRNKLPGHFLFPESRQFDEAREAFDPFGNQSDNEAALKRMAELYEALQTRIRETDITAGDLFQRMMRAGMEIPDRWKNQLQQMKDLGILTKENIKLFDELNDGQSNWRLMQDTAERFGIDIDSLGKGFQGGRIGARAQELIDAWELLTKGSPEAQGGVLFGMKDELQQLLNDALKHGLTLPENLRPLFEELLRTNQLTDPFTGEALQGIHEIRFGPAVLTEFEKISQDMEKFLASLDTNVTSAVKDGSQAIVDAINNIRFPEWTTNPGGDLGPGQREDGEGRAGGTFGATGRFTPEDFGDGEWMRLHGRETIVREDQQEQFVRDWLGRHGDRNQTRPGGDVVVLPIVMPGDDPDETTSKVIQRLGRRVAQNEAGIRTALRQVLVPREWRVRM